LVHDATSEALLYFPTSHVSQVEAPLAAPVLVIEPALQRRHSAAVEAPAVSTNRPGSHFEHAVTFDAVLYLPTSHTVQDVAPLSGPWFVMDPAAQSVQAVTFDSAL
jgi:hypothetical protein